MTAPRLRLVPAPQPLRAAPYLVTVAECIRCGAHIRDENVTWLPQLDKRGRAVCAVPVCAGGCE